MIDHKSFLSASLPGQGRRPALQIAVHAEEDGLMVALDPGETGRVLLHPPGPATVQQVLQVLQAEVGACELGSWLPFTEADGRTAGWMAEVRGPGVGPVMDRLHTG